MKLCNVKPTKVFLFSSDFFPPLFVLRGEYCLHCYYLLLCGRNFIEHYRISTFLRSALAQTELLGLRFYDGE